MAEIELKFQNRAYTSTQPTLAYSNKSKQPFYCQQNLSIGFQHRRFKKQKKICEIFGITTTTNSRIFFFLFTQNKTPNKIRSLVRLSLFGIVGFFVQLFSFVDFLFCIWLKRKKTDTNAVATVETELSMPVLCICNSLLWIFIWFAIYLFICHWFLPTHKQTLAKSLQLYKPSTDFPSFVSFFLVFFFFDFFVSFWMFLFCSLFI